MRRGARRESQERGSPGGPRGALRVRSSCVLALLVLLLQVLSSAAAASSVRPSALAAAPRAGLRDHPTRLKIVAHLKAVPGDHFRSIVRCVHESVGEVRHHLNVLQRSGRVREERTKDRCRYYLNEEAAADRNRMFGAYWNLRDSRARVLRVVEGQQAVRPSEVAETLGMSRQLADYHLQHLAVAGEIHQEQGSYRP